MKPSHSLSFQIPSVLLILAGLACGGGTNLVPTAEPNLPVAPLVIQGDLTQNDICKAVPQADVEAVMGRKITSTKSFAYDNTPGESGCWYEAAKDSDGEAHFGYVVLTPGTVYDNQALYENKDVSGLGQAAYFNNGADARQLWVKVNDQVALVVAFGDLPHEAGAQVLAQLVLTALK